ncbi:MAG: NRDE family protein [Saprospiraceae bacterium]|nr:NRDE family protein [Saprospiraceae bacterium]
MRPVRRSTSTVRVVAASLIFPRDTAAGGTWIAASDTNRVACLLNGAFVKHKHQPPTNAAGASWYSISSLRNGCGFL